MANAMQNYKNLTDIAILSVPNIFRIS